MSKDIETNKNIPGFKPLAFGKGHFSMPKLFILPWSEMTNL
jgi:hypothetical protein